MREHRSYGTATPSPTPAPAADPVLSGIKLASSSATAGDTVTGTVTLSAAAATGGFVVALAIDDADPVSVPPSITVPAGATRGTFTVAADDDLALPATITIAATAGDVTRTATLDVAPAEGVGPIASFGVAHDDVIGGDDTTATITLTAPAPADGVGFALSSDDDRVTVPGALVIPAGETSGTFDIDTAPVTGVVEAHITIALDLEPAPRSARQGVRDVATAAASTTLTLIVLPEPDNTDEPDDTKPDDTGADDSEPDDTEPDDTDEPAPNTAPTISAIGDQAIEEDTDTGALDFTVSDAETAADSLTVAGTSSNTTLVPDGNMVFGGSGANRTVTVTPAPDEMGTATITVTVSDGDVTTDATFTLTVTPGNTAPTISSIAPLDIFSDESTGALSFTVGDAETDAASLIVTATSSRTTVVPNGNIVFGGSGANRTITVTPVPDEDGYVRITVTVSDGEATTDETFGIDVDLRPPPPTLTGVRSRSSVRDQVIQVELIGTNFDHYGGSLTVDVSGGVVVTDVRRNPTDAYSKSAYATFTNDGQLATSDREVTVTTSGGSATLKVTTPPTPTDGSFTGLENARCVKVTFGSDPNPAAATDVIVTKDPQKGQLYTSDLVHEVEVGTRIPSSTGLCFVPDPYDYSSPDGAVSTTFEYRLRSYTVAGPIESVEGTVGTVEIVINGIGDGMLP